MSTDLPINNYGLNRPNRPNRPQMDLANPPWENLSFAGCGFLGIYHIGVASCFAEYCPQLSMHKIAGSSAGALVATAHICGNLELARLMSGLLKVALQARAKSLGPFHPSFNINEIIHEALTRGLPDDAHLRASGKLHVSLTRVSDGENVIIKQFDSKDDLIQCLICSCFIPFWSGITPPKLQGVPYIDGGFSDNLLRLDQYTITVSPFSGEADICPQDDTNNLLQIYVANTSFSVSPGNLYRVSHALLPPPPEILSRLCQQGFDDAMRYLQFTNHISCTRCIAIKSSSFNVADDSYDYDNELSDDNDDVDLKEPVHNHMSLTKCDDCEERRKLASFDGLPDQFAHVIRDACDQVNRSLSNWIYSHRPIMYLSLAASPCIMPLDIAVHIVFKLWQRVPGIRRDCLRTIHKLVKFLQSQLIRKQEHSKRRKDSIKGSTRFSCRMDITEYNYSNSVRRHVSAASIKRVPSSSSLASRKSSTPTVVSRHSIATDINVRLIDWQIGD
ncbi:Patatin-like phospholipase domain-containing protein 2 [Fragariocoptes setiger]|uniref:Patatin-like phospholipase domain-containing protein 2 n=1 Tax=Fragariocoptes setiger TaxID=1670756 RepID=A0ABQ7S617_9ACAR|nr:Patatin-like phospholipase domain-containing protein 2 [Fragariocoptes setiger]